MDISGLKAHIKTTVDKKISLTRERREYKLRTRGKVPEVERWCFFASIDDDRSITKGEIRHSLLAYAYVRNRPYRTLEAKVREGNEPSARHIFGILRRFGVEENANELLDAIQQWLSAPLEPVEEAA
jgi:hypothetical protein